jgi:hypothetical protein
MDLKTIQQIAPIVKRIERLTDKLKQIDALLSETSKYNEGLPIRIHYGGGNDEIMLHHDDINTRDIIEEIRDLIDMKISEDVLLINNMDA